jgi:hypothetical protein
MIKIINKAMSFLTDEERFAFCAHHLDGSSWDDIATQLGRKTGESLRVGISKKLKRARKGLEQVHTTIMSAEFAAPPSENE